jgi:hypothetical protein
MEPSLNAMNHLLKSERWELIRAFQSEDRWSVYTGLEYFQSP